MKGTLTKASNVLLFSLNKIRDTLCRTTSLSLSHIDFDVQGRSEREGLEMAKVVGPGPRK